MARLSLKRIANRLAFSVVVDRVASRLAKELVAFEFPTQDALDDYLKQHPKADKKRHWVKPQPGQKPAQAQPTQLRAPQPSKPADASKIKIPQNKMIQVQAAGDFSNLGSWKVKIMIGNSMGENQKVGDWDEVGYMAINPDNGEVIPIAQADEHKIGYDYLYTMQDKGLLDDASKFITLSGRGHDYTEKYGNELPRFLKTLKFWRQHGGRNIILEGQDPKTREKVTTDTDEYVEKQGKIDSRETHQIGQRFLDTVDSFFGATKAKDTEGAIKAAKEFTSQTDDYANYAMRFDSEKEPYWHDSIDNPDEPSYRKDLRKAIDNRDLETMTKIIGKLSRKVADSLSSKDRWQREYATAIFGTKQTDEVKNRLNRASGPATTEKPEQAYKPKAISPRANTIVYYLQQSAKKTLREDNSAFEDADYLLRAVKSLNLKDEAVEKAIEKVDSAIKSYKNDYLMLTLFDFNGLKNVLHNYLRRAKKEGKVDDEYFGDVDEALKEFSKLGDI